MSKIAIFLLICLAVVQAVAWDFTIYKGTNYSGESKYFEGNICTDGCINIPSNMNNKVHSFVFGTTEGLRCRIKMYENANCKGKKLGESKGPWSKSSVSAEGQKMSSFNIGL